MKKEPAKSLGLREPIVDLAVKLFSEHARWRAAIRRPIEGFEEGAAP